jgi:hypothetical protein
MKLARKLWESYEYAVTRNNRHQDSAAEYGNPRSRNTSARSRILNMHRKTGQLPFLGHVTFSCVLKQFSMEERLVVCKKPSRICPTRHVVQMVQECMHIWKRGAETVRKNFSCFLEILSTFRFQQVPKYAVNVHMD